MTIARIAALLLCLSCAPLWIGRSYAGPSSAPYREDDTDPVPVCVRHAPPCADPDVLCWQCAVVTLLLTVEDRERDIDKLRHAWAASDEHARAQERLAEHATEAARAVTGRDWWLHPAIWFLAGGLLIGGAAVGGAVAIGAIR